MYIYRLTKYKDLVSKTAFTVAVLIASLTLIGCESSDDDDEPGTVDTGTTDTGTTDTGTTDTGTTDTGTTDTGIVGGLMPDNDPAEIFGDWATGNAMLNTYTPSIRIPGQNSLNVMRWTIRRVPSG